MILKVNLGTDRSPNWVELEASSAKTLDGYTVEDLIKRTHDTIAPKLIAQITAQLTEELTETITNQLNQQVINVVTNVIGDSESFQAIQSTLTSLQKEIKDARGPYSRLVTRLDAIDMSIANLQVGAPEEDVTTIDGGVYDMNGVVPNVDGAYDGGVYNADGIVEGVTSITDGGQI